MALATITRESRSLSEQEWIEKQQTLTQAATLPGVLLVGACNVDTSDYAIIDSTTHTLSNVTVFHIGANEIRLGTGESLEGVFISGLRMLNREEGTRRIEEPFVGAAATYLIPE